MNCTARLAISLIVIWGTAVLAADTQLAGTTTFDPPVEISLGEMPPDFGHHAVTRLVDWDANGEDDLLVGAGDGKVWLIRNQGDRRFAKPEPVIINGSPLQAGKELTTACFVDMNGDLKLDLVIAHDDTQVSMLENRGTRQEPKFVELKAVPGPGSMPLELTKGCGGRIDAGDWDKDGDVDLVAGTFSGPILCYRNTGTAQQPQFGVGVALTLGKTEPAYSYNVHPTLFDVNRDGILDFAYGMNWGTISFLIASPQAATGQPPTIPNTVTEVAPILSTGKPMELRAIAGDDTTPTFGDLDGDGTLDMISGGRNGKLFWLRGVPTSQRLDRISAIMRAHSLNLGADLQQDETLRTELLGLHHGIYRLCQGFLNTPGSRRQIRDWYVRHLAEYAPWLKRGHHDIKTQPYIPSLACQTWTLLMLLHDGNPDAQTHRQFVAETIGFEGRLRDILIEFGTLIIENGRATANQQETLYSYLSQIPAPLLGDRSVNAVTEVITIGEYLGPRLEVLHAGGVNIFANESGTPGSSENSFPNDFKPCENDYFGLVLAHELNHRVDATRFVAVPKYNQKYWRHMRKIAGADVKFVPPDGIGVDWEATKKHFRVEKLWDGEASNWNTAWGDYWLTGPGKTRTLNVCRNETTYTPPRYGIPFFLETRQESIASLANQYLSDSEHMLQFALHRFERGAPGCLDEWLLMADVYSMDQPRTYLYRHENGSVYLAREEAELTRDSLGNIETITIDQKTYQFTLDADGLVEQVRVR